MTDRRKLGGKGHTMRFSDPGTAKKSDLAFTAMLLGAAVTDPTVRHDMSTTASARQTFVRSFNSRWKKIPSAAEGEGELPATVDGTAAGLTARHTDTAGRAMRLARIEPACEQAAGPARRVQAFVPAATTENRKEF